LSSARRPSALPDVPTVAEAGVPGFDFPIQTPALRASLANHGGEPMSMTQPDFTRFVLREIESAARIIEAAGIKPQ
jgi:tripartite-type tricarboxylate transporter receptor subunit TctC